MMTIKDFLYFALNKIEEDDDLFLEGERYIVNDYIPELSGTPFYTKKEAKEFYREWKKEKEEIDDRTPNSKDFIMEEII